VNGLEFERRDDDPQARMHRRREAADLLTRGLLALGFQQVDGGGPREEE